MLDQFLDNDQIERSGHAIGRDVLDRSDLGQQHILLDSFSCLFLDLVDEGHAGIACLLSRWFDTSRT